MTKERKEFWGDHIFIAIVILMCLFFSMIFNVITAGAETSLGANFGYHAWTNSGHTFKNSSKGDKHFNRPSWNIECNHWRGPVGVYGYVGRDFNVNERMWHGFNYRAKTHLCGMGIQARKRFRRSCVYIGGGGNYTKLQNYYGSYGRETFREFGYDVKIGGNVYIINNYFISVNGLYTWNKMWSDFYGETSFNPDGLRTFLGIGHTWK